MGFQPVISSPFPGKERPLKNLVEVKLKDQRMFLQWYVEGFSFDTLPPNAIAKFINIIFLRGQTRSEMTVFPQKLLMIFYFSGIFVSKQSQLGREFAVVRPILCDTRWPYPDCWKET